MKKLLTTFSLFAGIFAAAQAATITINSAGLTFSPASVNINSSDEVVFSISGSHNAVEISEATWNANGSTALAGGFSLGFGGGTLSAGTLSAGTHYYVCTPHAGAGMKGKIVVQGGASTTTISSAGLTFSPAEVTITTADQVVFSIGGNHNAVEVSEATWNANGSTALAGGFSLGFGGGTLSAGTLSVGTHYYVCTPHAGAGMKGKIIVQSTTGVKNQLATSYGAFPNPSSGKLFLQNSQMAGKAFRIMNLEGKVVYRGIAPSMPEGIDVSSLLKGSYFMIMEGAEQAPIRFIKD
jgi:plastocyanin